MARNSQESRAKPNSRAKSDIEQRERSEEVNPPQKIVKIHILGTEQSAGLKRQSVFSSGDPDIC